MSSDRVVYRFGPNDRYYIDSEGAVEEIDTDPQAAPQAGQIPRFVAAEMIRLDNERREAWHVAAQNERNTERLQCGADPASKSEISYAQGIEDERDRIRTELIDWLIGDIDPKDAGIVNSRRIVDEIDRICPKES